MRYCGVYMCLQKGGKDKFGKRVSYHRVPSSQPDRKKWLQLIRRRDYLYNSISGIHVCSLHFKEDDFVKNVANNKGRLCDGVFPSIFPWPSFEEVSSRKEEPRKQNVEKTNAYLNTPKSTQMEKESGRALTPSETLLGRENESKVMITDKLHSNGEAATGGKKTHAIVKPTRQQLMDENEVLLKEIDILKKRVECEIKNNYILKYNLEKTPKELREENEKKIFLENKLRKMTFSLESIKYSEEDICFYTGFENYDKVINLFAHLNPGDNGENVILWRGKNTELDERKLTVMDQFLVVMMRLRLGLMVKDLAYRFGVSESVISCTCISWINFMYLRLGQMNIWSERKDIDEHMPDVFKEKYPSTRIIIDAAEIKCEVSKSMVLQTATYSNYKSTNTYKGLIGINPNGYVTFVSALHTGNISDKELARKSGFLGLAFDGNDSVMADKGFVIEDLLKELPVKVTLNIPAFLREKSQFSKEEIIEWPNIAKLRIHKIKQFHIFDRPIPITLSPMINQIWTVVVLLTNFQSPILKCEGNELWNH